MAETSFINIRTSLAEKLRPAAQSISPEAEGMDIAISPCQDPRFGDYQTNLAMAIGKKSKLPPRDVAEKIISKTDISEFCETPEIAGAGFINFRLKTEFTTRQLIAMAKDSHLGISQISNSPRIVTDFSGPNIAKSMHVGHIRSSFLGDTLTRILKAAGYGVISDNHLGDWGTQFGKLIYGYKHFLDPEKLKLSPIEEFERLYKKTHELTETDENILVAAREELAKLQNGDHENLRIWKEISNQSLQELETAYRKMDIHFDHQLGESFFNPYLQDVIKELQNLGIAEESEGAICIFFRNDEDLKNAAPMIIQKGDGAALYATTDLAAVRYRVQEWRADQMIYVTDSRQQLHFKQLKAAVEQWVARTPPDQTRSWKNWPHPPQITHVYFGSILGEDKKPIKTRSGEPIKLKDLLEEAEARSLQIIREKNPELSQAEQNEAARVIGIGALKYADLCQNRNLDYIFDWNKLLALQGNTAPYLIYAYVRIRSIFRSIPHFESTYSSFSVTEPEEIALGKHLIQFGSIIHAVLEDYRPHLLCSYLYELAVRFSKFYESCPVLKAEEPIRSSRLALCDLASKVLKRGLELLGIETLEKM